MPQSKEEIAAYQKAYRKAHKEELAAKAVAYREANKEKIAARAKAYREANREKLRASRRAWREANIEKCRIAVKRWSVANKEHLQEYQKAYAASGKRKQYQQQNKHIFQKNTAKYRALKRKQVPVHLRDCPHEKQRLLQTYKMRDILSKATGVEHHVDHMWPLADGGPHWSGNLQVIPAEENLSKNASVCEETKNTIIKSLYTSESERSI